MPFRILYVDIRTHLCTTIHLETAMNTQLFMHQVLSVNMYTFFTTQSLTMIHYYLNTAIWQLNINNCTKYLFSNLAVW